MPDIEYLGATERSIGTLYLCRWPSQGAVGGLVYEVYIDGALLMSSVSPLSERLLATRALEAHSGGDRPLRVLVGGLGLGYTAEAALESKAVADVRVIDRIDVVIDWMREGLLPLSEQLNADKRLSLMTGDVYDDLLGPATESWDLILVDVDHAPQMPLDPASLPFYTEEGQAAVRRHLAPGGILAVWSAHDDEPFAAALARAYPRSWRDYIEWTSDIGGPREEVLHNTLFFGVNEPAAADAEA
jgi:spermidine synthase